MLCNIKPVPFHESDKHISAKIPVGGGGFRTPRSPPLDPPMDVSSISPSPTMSSTSSMMNPLILATFRFLSATAFKSLLNNPKF